MKLRAYKFRIYPDDTQAQKLANSFGCVRWFWNNSLALSNKFYEETGKRPSRFDLQARLPGLKKAEETKWLKEAPSQALQFTLKAQEAAWKAFFRNPKEAGIPKFKHRNRRQSITFPEGGEVDFAGAKLIAPKFLEGIRANFHRKFAGVTKSVTISKTPAGKYYAAVLVEEAGEELQIRNPELDSCLGIDLGTREFAVMSDGSRMANPKHLSKKLKKLRRAQRKLSRCQKSSNRRDKQRIRVARQHEKVASARSDFQHKLTSRLVENQDYGSFALEDLSVAGMLKDNPAWMSRAISDAAFFQFRTLLVYKANRAGKTVLFADRYAPTTKTCGVCGHVHDVPRSAKGWVCPKCGTTHDRDLNAAVNIKRMAFGQYLSGLTVGDTAGTAGIQARGAPKGRRTAKSPLEQAKACASEAHPFTGGVVHTRKP